MPNQKSRIRLGRIIYLIVTLAALGVVLWYFAPQYLELIDRAATGE